MRAGEACVGKFRETQVRAGEIGTGKIGRGKGGLDEVAVGKICGAEHQLGLLALRPVDTRPRVVAAFGKRRGDNKRDEKQPSRGARPQGSKLVETSDRRAALRRSFGRICHLANLSSVSIYLFGPVRARKIGTDPGIHASSGERFRPLARTCTPHPSHWRAMTFLT